MLKVSCIRLQTPERQGLYIYIISKSKLAERFCAQEKKVNLNKELQAGKRKAEAVKFSFASNHVDFVLIYSPIRHTQHAHSYFKVPQRPVGKR